MTFIFGRLWSSLTGFGVIAAIMASIVWGTNLPKFALWKFFVLLVPVIIYVLFFIASKDSLKFLFFTIFSALPVLGVRMPPVSLGITPLDIVFVLTTITIFALSKIRKINLMPMPTLVIGILLVLPSIAVAIDPIKAVVEGARLVGAYMVFVLLRHYLSSEEIRANVDVILVGVMVVVALSVLLERFTGINLSNSGTSLNSISIIDQNTIQRVGGIFQDPQKAGQFLAVLIVYIAVLWSRGIFSSKLFYLVFASFLLGISALLSTVSRLAIGSGLVIALSGFLFLSNGLFIKRMAMILFVTGVGLGVSLNMSETDLMKKIVPKDLLLRFTTTSESADDRLSIWKDSWQIFKDNPVFGIGPGTYQEYLMRRDPQLRRLHESGGYVPQQPESGYLTILYEMGLLGAMGFILVLMTTVIRIVRNLVVSKNFHFRSYTWATAAGSIVYFACFFTLFTPADPRNAILPLILLALLPSSEEKWEESN